MRLSGLRENANCGREWGRGTLTPNDVPGRNPVVGVFVGVVQDVLARDGYNTNPVQRHVSVPAS